MKIGLTLGLTGMLLVGSTLVLNPQSTTRADTINIPTVQPSVLSERSYPKSEYPVDTLTVGTNDQVECLAKNIFFEAGNQEVAGMYAVAHVTLNRVRSNQFPDTVCKVVYQAEVSKWHLENTGKRVPVLNRCQFSWYCDGQSDAPLDGESWRTAMNVAQEMYSRFLTDDLPLDITDKALYYHATYVKPKWARTMKRVARIGDHIFYR